MGNKKGIFVNYQMAEAIKMLSKYDMTNANDRKTAEQELEILKNRWLTQDKIPGYGISIGDKIAGMKNLTIDEVVKFSEDIKTADTYSTECIGNMQYCLTRSEDGTIDFDFSYLKHIADLARANDKKLVIDSAVVFGDRFPENMANMSPEEIANAIAIYTQKLTREFGDCIERIDVLNSVFQRDDVFDRNGKINSEKFWIDKFGQDYASKVISIVRKNCQNPDIALCWNEFYMTKAGSEKRLEDFIATFEGIENLDVIGLQDNFRPDTSCKHIESSLERVVEACRKSGKQLSITELSCKVGKRDTERLDEAMQNGGYSSKVKELNDRIKKVLKTVIDFSEKNSDIISSVEARYSDRYDCNHRECEQYGHNIETSIRRDNNFEQPEVLKTEDDATPVIISNDRDEKSDVGDFASTLRGGVKTIEEIAAEMGTNDDNEVKRKVIETQDRSEI